jgi:hypothetical protein
MPREALPPLHLPRGPRVDSPDVRVLDRIKEVRGQIAAELGIDESLVANRLQLVSLSLESRATVEAIRAGTPMMEWQYGLLTEDLLRIGLRGEWIKA